MAAAAPIPPVTLPFPDYKWRWMETVPVESFNRLDILLGVTRAIRACEGLSANSDEFEAKMHNLQDDFFPQRLGYQPSFPRSENGRTVLRRQGGYWRGLGLLEGQADELTLTNIGRAFANGSMTISDFVQWTVQNEELPGIVVRSLTGRKPWLSSGIVVRPLSIIVGVLLELARDDNSEAYLTTLELAKVLVPLHIVWPNVADLASAVLRFRTSPFAFAHLPNCAASSNDLRMLREHLLFLHNGGFLSVQHLGPNRFHHRFGLTKAEAVVAAEMAGQPVNDENAVAQLPITVIEFIQRTKKTTEILNRSGQAQFRAKTLANCGGRCALSGEMLQDVLIACHIHEVKDGGSDDVSNGIMLRSDLHILFDCNKIRISQDGAVVVSPDVTACANYADLPINIGLPQNLNKEALRRRFLYGAVIVDVEE